MRAEPTRHRVLVVDDDPGIRHMLAVLLTEEGYAVRTAVDGEEGLRIASDWQPHVILVDLVMPKMNGYTFAAEYRRVSLSLTTRASVFAMTAAERAAERTAHELPFDEVVRKPYAVDRLLEMLAYHARLRAG
jgi:CheY-like chemotaxis protein